jgi:lysophospholipase L1-like esterase
MKRQHAFGTLLAGALVALAALPTHASHAQPVVAASVPHQGTYYLALGDSLSAGYQPDPSIVWTHGWVYQFRTMLAKHAPVELTNLALGGECTGTFIKGGLDPACPTKRVDSPAQLAEAVAFIKAHPGQVNPITVEVGGDNLYGNLPAFLTGTPTAQQALLTKIFTPLAPDWVTIFSTLREACPTCDIIAVNQYNPFPKGAVKADVGSVVTTYNALLMKATHAAKIRVADVYTPFVGHELDYTWTAHADIHANTAGYKVMAQTVAKASGLVQ